MLLNRLVLILAVAGFATVFVGWYVLSLDTGSCPANYLYCSHTFSGTDIWIGSTARVISLVGFVILVGALALWAISSPYSKKGYHTKVFQGWNNILLSCFVNIEYRFIPLCRNAGSQVCYRAVKPCSVRLCSFAISSQHEAELHV